MPQNNERQLVVTKNSPILLYMFVHNVNNVSANLVIVSRPSSIVQQ